MSISDVFAQIMQFVMSFKDLPSYAQVSGIVLIIVSLAKTSFVQPFWDKFGDFKILVAPGLGFIAALVSIHPLTFSAVMASIAGGTLAIGLHELMDAFKKIPVIGPKYEGIINFFEKLLHAPAKQEAIPETKSFAGSAKKKISKK